MEKKKNGTQSIITTGTGSNSYGSGGMAANLGSNYVSEGAKAIPSSDYNLDLQGVSKASTLINKPFKTIYTTDNNQKFESSDLSGDPERTESDSEMDVIQYYKDRAKINRELVKLTNKSNTLVSLISKLEKSANQKDKSTELMTRNLEDVKSQFSDLLIKITNNEKKVNEFKADLEHSRNSFLGIIALFASFFSFISVSINIFSKEMSIGTSISIVVIMWVCLISFVFVFMAALSKGFSYFSSGSIIRHFLAVILCIIMALVVPGFIIKLL